MASDRISQFELLLLELNRNIAYNEQSQITENYNMLSAIYQDILKTDVSIEEKNRFYNSIIEAHENIKRMNSPKHNIAKPALVTFSGLIATVFLFKGPELTGMATSQSSNILNPLARFAPIVILAGIILFILLKKKNKK